MLEAMIGKECRKLVRPGRIEIDDNAVAHGGEMTGIYALTVRRTIAAAHRLKEYGGNCERLHGHTGGSR